MPKGIKKQYVIFGITKDNRKRYYMNADDGFSGKEFATRYPDLQSAKRSLPSLKGRYSGKDKLFMVMGYEPVD